MKHIACRLEPRRIAAVPNTVLDVVVDTPVADNVGFASPLVRHLELQSVPPQDDSMIKVEVVSQDAISTPSSTLMPIVVAVTSTPNATAAPTATAASYVTSTVRRNPVYGLVEAAMENYTHIDRPLEFPLARGPHAALDDLLAPSYPIGDDEAQQRAPQSAISSLSVEMKWAEAIINASHGDKDAQVVLGDMYRDGKGVAQDYQAAMDWYLKAVEQGDAAGQQRVGALYEEGFGVPKNHSIAMDWYLKAAEQGYAIAQDSIGVLYNFGQGVRRDYGRAMDWYLKAAEQGYALSQYSIGCLYRNGEGVPQDYAQAMKWFLKAANQGDSFAQNNIGLLYNHGRSVPLDYAQAMDWFLKAAKQGNDVAQFNIGLCYINGQGVPQDYTKAAGWFSKAARRGHDYAKIVLEALQGIGVV
ncbi:hypothetical protein BGX30_005955, partial [Mortierella sp. GBA39]